MALYGSNGIHTRGTVFLVGGVRVASAMSFTGLGSGETTQVDTTTLDSSAKESITGFKDEGTISADGVLVPYSESAEKLHDLRDSRQSAAWTAVCGGALDPVSKLCTGEGLERTEVLQFTTIADGGTDLYTLTTSNTIDELPPISVNEYIKIGTANHRVAAVSHTGNAGVLTLESATDIADVDGGDFQVVKPAFAFTWRGYVVQFSTDFNVDDAIKYTLSISVNGEITRHKGTPDLPANIRP